MYSHGPPGKAGRILRVLARSDPDVRRVIPTPDAEKAVRAAGYTKGIDGWRAGRAVLDAQERIRKAEQRPEALRPDDPGAMRTVRRRQEYARLQGELMRAQRVIESLRHDRAILKNSAETAQKRLAALRKQLDQTARVLLDRTPEKERLALAQELDEAGIRTGPTRALLDQAWYRARQEREQDTGLGL